MIPVKLFSTQQEMEDYIDQAVVEKPQVFFYSCEENGVVISGIKQPLPPPPPPVMVDCLIIGCDGEDGIDDDGYYQFDGEWEYEGTTYYKWKRISNNWFPAAAGRVGLTTERTFEDASEDNRYNFDGWLIKDSLDSEYNYDDIRGFEQREKVDASLPHHDTSTLNSNGHEYVNLGLPSGALWAKYNVGAGAEDEYGLYFQWGDINGYTGEDAREHSYWSTCPFNNGSDDYNERYFLLHKSDWLDDKDELKIEYDAARNNMGGDWHMPPVELIVELMNNTISEWITDYEGSGVNGRLFTSIINGNTLFIPAAGYFDVGYFNDEGSYGYYWSSRLNSSYPSYAFLLDFYSDGVYMNNRERLCGFPVRGVLW